MKHKLAPLLLALLCASSSFAQRKDFDLPTMHAARGTRGALASGSDYAEEAGMRTYFHGGNAVDAGVAAMFAASVSEFSHFGLGGEAPILIRTKAGKVYAIAGVGTMPKLATAKFFMEHRPQAGRNPHARAGRPERHHPGRRHSARSRAQHGGVRLGRSARFRHQIVRRSIEPAIELADGMAIDEMRSGSIARSRRFFDLWPDSKKTFLPDGRVPHAGRDLPPAQSRAHLARHGRRRKESAGRRSYPRRRHRCRRRLLLPWRNRAQNRCLHASQRRPAAL